MTKPSGYIIYENDRIVVIATGINRPTRVNRKTGRMIQIWTLGKHENPHKAIHDGNDKIICFNCPMRGELKVKDDGTTVNINRKCYVNTARAPYMVWEKYNRGGYDYLTDYSVFDNQPVRLGAYGEPVLIPITIIREITKRASLWTGYSHRWQLAAYQGYKKYLMASCTEGDAHKAHKLGWRAFITTETVKKVRGSATCPASHEMGQRVHCSECGACSGSLGRGTKDINIAVHARR